MAKIYNLHEKTRKGEEKETTHAADHTRSKEINTLTDAFYDNLPYPLNSFAGMNGQTRDAAFLSSIVALSATLPNYGTTIRGSFFSPHLYLIINGESGSGKSILTKGADVITAITKEQKEAREEDQANYTRDLAAFNAGNTEEMPSEPPNTCTNIPASITTSAFFKRMQKQPHGGLMTLTELDAFSKNITTEHGQGLSALMRAAWNHEEIQRETISGSTIEIECPKLAALFSGTPNQLKKLIGKNGDGLENGLLSRFMYYNMVHTGLVHNTGATHETHAPYIPGFPGISLKLRDIYNELKGRGSTLLAEYDRTGEYIEKKRGRQALSKGAKQYRKFNDTLSILERMGEQVSPFFKTSVVRMAMSCQRILTILTALRHAGELRTADVIYHCNKDVDAVCMLANVLTTHLFFSFSPHSVGAKRKKNKMDALSQLPTFFKFTDFENIVTAWGYNDITALRWLEKLLKINLIHKIDNGDYAKTTDTNNHD